MKFIKWIELHQGRRTQTEPYAFAGTALLVQPWSISGLKPTPSGGARILISGIEGEVEESVPEILALIDGVSEELMRDMTQTMMRLAAQPPPMKADELDS